MAEAENNAEILNTRAEEKHTWESQKAEEERLLAPLRRKQIEAQTDASRASAWASRNPVVKTGGTDPKLGAIQAAREAVLKDGPLGDGTLANRDGQKTLRTALVDSYGLSPNAVQDVVDEFYTTFKGGKAIRPYKKEDGTTGFAEFEIPVRTVLDAAGQTSEWFDGGFWSRRGDSTVSTLKKMLEDPEVVSEIIQHNRLKKEGDYSIVSAAEKAGYAIPSGKVSSPKR